MSIQYAAIMGFLAMGVSLLRSLRTTGAWPDELGHAVIALFGCAIVGFIVGSLADRVVKESVLQEMQLHFAQAAKDKDTATNDS